MKVKRNKLNEYIIKQFLDDEIKGYKSSLNGEWVWHLTNNELYGGKICKLRNDMGSTIIRVKEDNVEDVANRIQETYYELDKILEREKQISNYLTSDEGAWGRGS